MGPSVSIKLIGASRLFLYAACRVSRRSPMNLVSRLFWMAVLGSCALSQQSGVVPRSPKAAIEGIVTKDPSGEPVKKVLVELIAEDQKQGGDYHGTTGPDGACRIQNLLPGRFR
jgi:hypothetical protein